MKPSSFTYQKARSLDDVFVALAAHGDAAKVIAGGQSLGPMMNMRLAQPGHLIDLNGLADLDFIRESGGRIEIGALVRHHDLARSEIAHRCCPVLARAAETIGHYAIRQRGTIGGSFAHADPAAQLPLVGALLGAEIIVSSIRGQRRIAAADFLLSVFTTALEPDEIVTAVSFPVLDAGEGWGFRLFERRAGDFALVVVGATVRLAAGNKAERVRLAVGGVGPVPVCLADVAAGVEGAVADAAWAKAAGLAAARAVDPEDGRISAAYRRDLVAALVEDALNDGRAGAKQ